MRAFFAVTTCLLVGCNLLMEDWDRIEADSVTTFVEPVDCGAPDAPTNGKVTTGDGTSHMSKAVYSCVPGYEPIGDPTRTCGPDGLWSGSTPACALVSCSILYPPLDGSVDLSDGVEYEDVAFYECDTGYILSGNEERTCQPDGAWSDQAPTCLTHTSLSAVVTTEDWYGWEVTCASEEMTAMPVYSSGPLVVTLDQLPVGGPVIGTCIGHEAEVYLIGDNHIDIVLKAPTGGTCGTACFDFVVEVDVSALPAGPYTVTVGDHTTDVYFHL